MTHSSLLKKTDQCVKCGLCLTSCPTYQLMPQETESPRGRIAIVEAIAKQNISVSAKTFHHLQHCLNCRRCETVCPAQVDYHDIIEQGREIIFSQTKKYRSHFLVDKLLPYLIRWRSLQFISQTLLYYGQKCHLFSRLPKVTPWKKWPHTIRINQPATQSNQTIRAIYLLRGCIHTLFDAKTLTSACQLLQKSGYQVKFPSQARCCGGLAQLQGDRKTFAAYQRMNQNAFSDDLPITATASGCLLALSQQTTLRQRIIDIHQVLWQNRHRLHFRAYPHPVYLHLPCSMKNGLKTTDYMIKLVQLIPEIQLHILQTASCCGGSGDYFLRFPKIAKQLAKPIIEEWQSQPKSLLLSANLGCTLHLSMQIDENHLLQHPLTLLAQQLI